MSHTTTTRWAARKTLAFQLIGLSAIAASTGCYEVLEVDESLSRRDGGRIGDGSARSEPTCDGVALAGDSCIASCDCGAGLACDTLAGACVAGYAGANGVSPSAIAIGQVASLTGTSATTSEQLRRGVSTYFKRVNDEGGIHGRALELITADDGGEPTEAVAQMSSLTGAGPTGRRVFALVGNGPAAGSGGPIDVAVANRTPVVGPYDGSRDLRSSAPNRYVFNYRASDEQEGDAIVHWMVTKREAGTILPSNIAIFAEADGNDPMVLTTRGASGAAALTSALTARGAAEGTIVSYPRGTTTVDEAMRSLLRWLTSDAVVEQANGQVLAAVSGAASGPAMVELIIRLRDALTDAQIGRRPFELPPEILDHAWERLARTNVIFTALSWVDFDSLASELDARVRRCGNVFVTQVVPLASGTSPAAIQFRRDLARFEGTGLPTHAAFEAYLAAAVLVEGLRAAGPDLHSEGFVTALESLGSFDLGVELALDLGAADHQASDTVWATLLTERCDVQTFELR